ncbi:MAG TPA: GH1 family beta-glucosidase [Gaiellaceae bacterium]|nr:GH1 family beta-glucosidase [Gaiellaceae bacterium]
MTAQLPPGFLWGVASSAYQTEGATGAGGRGVSVWDTFCATPGKVRAGASGDLACDFYHRYPEDIGLMRQLGIDAFRFSIAWPRVLPAGRGRVNQRGLDFYDRLVDALLAAGIRPFVNLFHWDTPQPLEDAGGWPRRETAEAFVELAAAVADRLGDRVADWITMNEPYCPAWLGYGLGIHAPGRAGAAEALAAAHHLLLAHGWAVETLRTFSPRAEVGLVLDSWPVHPATDTEADVAAAWAADGVANRWFFDAVLLGSYPEDVLERFDGSLPAIREGDLDTISARLDFVGMNNYSRRRVRAGRGGAPVDVRSPTGDLTDTGWEVYPRALYEVLTRLRFEYGAPSLYVTENGAAFADTRTHDGRVHDVERIAYLQGYLGAVSDAIAAGVPVRGYFVWSLLDNFEWALGYAKRFGLVYVDYPTQERVPKDSFRWYQGVIAAHRGSDALSGAHTPTSAGAP